MTCDHALTVPASVTRDELVRSTTLKGKCQECGSEVTCEVHDFDIHNLINPKLEWKSRDEGEKVIRKISFND